MKIKCSIFFDIDDVESFCKNILHNDSKFEINHEDDSVYLHEAITKNEMKSIPLKPELKLIDYEGYTFRQKDGVVINVNNVGDNFYTNLYNTWRVFGTKSLYLVIDTEGTYPAYMLNFYQGKTERVIYSIKDGARWVFFQKGEQQPFENGDLYSERGATKKFNYKKITSFCKNLGLSVEDPDFLTPTGPVYHTTVAK